MHQRPPTAEFFKWFGAVLLTGVLIGLGGPFWFDLAVRLSQFRQTRSSRDEESEQEEPRDDDDIHADPENRLKMFEGQA